MGISVERIHVIEKSIEAIQHHYKCCNSSDKKSCQIISCKKISKLDVHFRTCARRSSCNICKQFTALLKYHSEKCRDNNCEVLNCRENRR